MLSLIVDTNGEPDDIAVLLPLGEGLDEGQWKPSKAGVSNRVQGRTTGSCSSHH